MQKFAFLEKVVQTNLGGQLDPVAVVICCLEVLNRILDHSPEVHPCTQLSVNASVKYLTMYTNGARYDDDTHNCKE